MPKASKPLLVPVNLCGGIYHSTDYLRGAESALDAAYIDNECFDKSGHTRWGACYYMAEVEPFTARLRVVGVGHKSTHVELVDEDGNTWPMFTSDYVALMTFGNVLHGWIETLTYETCKKSSAYGIRLKIG